MSNTSLPQALCRELGMAALTPDANGACGLHFEDGLQVDLQFAYAENQLRLAAYLGQVVPSYRLEIFTAMLLGNTFLAEHGLPCVAFETDRECLALIQTADLTGAAAQLAEVVRALAAAAREARSRLLQEALLV